MGFAVKITNEQMAFLTVSTVVVFVLLGMVGAYDVDPTIGDPTVMGHSLAELNLSLLYIDPVSGRVGIGTANPGKQLTITGCLRFDNAGTGDVDVDFCNDDASYNDDGVTLRVTVNPAAGEPIFRVLSSGGSERLRVEHSGALKTTNTIEVDGTGDSYIMGNVGIGTTNPGNKLEVQGGAISVYGPVSAGSGLTLSDEGAYKRIQTYGNEPLAINPLGNNVGIGTANPGAKLEVSGGYVLVPDRPAFSVSLTNHWTAQGVILFDIIGVNNGNHYSSATGRFTAPVGGLYQLCFGGIEYPQAGRSYADIRVNGVRPAGGRIFSQAGTTYDGSYKCIIANLNTGDYVDVYNMDTIGQGWYQNPYALFSGHLL